MTEAFLVIDGRPGTPQSPRKGLPHAPAYYAAFAQEPSPFGMLTFVPAKTTVMFDDYSLFVVLAELAKAGSDGAAMLVCHAWEDGLGLPLAQGGRTVFAKTNSLDTIDTLIGHDATHDRIRAMPQTSPADRKAVVDAWGPFYTSLAWPDSISHPRPLPAGYSDAQAETLYQQWFAAWASALEFRNAADLRELFRRVKALRTAKLDRIELRACNIGSDPTSMARVRKFFGCAKLTAPTVHTIFGVIAVGAMVVVHRPRGSHAPTLPAGPLQHNDFRDAVASGELLLQTSTRGFLHFTDAVITSRHEPVRPHSPIFQLPAVELFGGFRFVLRIIQTGGINFGSAAWAAGSAKNPAPDPEFIKQFCARAFKTDTLFHDVNLPHAGLWTPGEAKPFVFPLEPEYLAHIAQSPAPQPKKP